VKLNVSAELAELSDKAAEMSVQQGQFYVGVEHLFAAILEDPDRLPAKLREHHLNTLFTMHREMLRTAWRGGINSPGGEVFHTPRAIAVTSAAAKIAQRMGHGAAGAGHLLLAILMQEHSGPSRAMDSLNMDRKAFCEALKNCIAPGQALQQAGPNGTPRPAAKPAFVEEQRDLPGAEALGTYLPFDEGVPVQRGDQPKQAQPQLTRDLMAAAREGKLQPVIGREQEIVSILQILTRKNKNNAMLVGEAGVGKTQLVEGLALKLAENKFGDAVPPFKVYELSISALMTGTAYRGAFEEKVLNLIEGLKRDPNAVLFIDEVHLIMGAGATDGDAMDMANLLKPVLARGEIRVIGATTLAEYRKFVEKDPAIERRFQMVRLEELSAEATLQVLQRVKPGLEKHHGVRISTGAIETAVSATERYMPNLNFPDKAIDVLDQACSRQRLNMRAGFSSNTFGSDPNPDPTRVTRHGVLKVVSQITSIPLEEMSAEERRNIRDLDKRVKKRVIGQDEAVERVVSAVKKSRAGLADPNRPDSVMLFLGPSGVGKTQLAKTLSRELFGSKDHLIVFDMSEYIEEHSVSRLLGAPPGYVGSDEEGRLSGAVRNNPFCILLFDEIEKAHPRIFDIFLPIFDEGRLKDNRGRMISFRNTIILLTSNIGADLISHSEGGVDSNMLVDELRKHFRPELINRIDEIVPFYPLLQEDVRSILRIEINSLRHRLQDRSIKIHMYQQAYEFLGEKGYKRGTGARELRRVVDKYLTGPISELLLNDGIQDGDVVDVKMEDGELVVCKGEHSAKTSGVA
jgi:ATP-dependent Clp protease ATP-binding subunit ClpC